MKRLWLFAFFWLLSASFNVSAVEVVAAEFGVFDASDPQRVIFEPTRIVPHREGQRYGWMIELRGAKRSVSVREEYLLPSRAVEGRTDSAEGTKLVIPLDRRNQVSQRQLVPVDGRIYGEWSIGPQEPPGRRQLDVVVEGQVAASFEFEVR
jgi:hypothetical protein